MKEKLVLIGNGMAGMRTVDELLKLAPLKYDITVFGAEPHGNYNRIMLSPVLAGDKTIDEIVIHDVQWYQDHNITLHTGSTVTAINRGNRTVSTDDGVTADYDRLVLATGSLPVMLPIAGLELDGVISFRDINDVNVMIATAATHNKAIVIGGGLLGLEAANGLMMQGMDVAVVHKSNTLMNQQLDQVASDLMRQQLTATGMRFLMNHNTVACVGSERVTKVRFADGCEVAADLVVMAVGVKPNIQLAKAAGIQCDQGIIVDDTLQTFSPNIYAVGECVLHRNQTFGLVAPLYQQAKVCANHLAHIGSARYISSAAPTKLKVTGIDVFSAGDFIGDDTTEELIFRDPTRYIYKKLLLRDNKIVGIILYGDTTDGNWYCRLLDDQQDISAMRADILFGQHHVDAA